MVCDCDRGGRGRNPQKMGAPNLGGFLLLVNKYCVNSSAWRANGRSEGPPLVA